MNNKLTLLFLVILMQFSCKNDNEERLADNLRDAKKKELIFKTINKGWNFIDTPINTTSESTLKTWPEWRAFMEELSIKPKKTITAFQKKAKKGISTPKQDVDLIKQRYKEAKELESHEKTREH